MPDAVVILGFALEELVTVLPGPEAVVGITQQPAMKICDLFADSFHG
jgi:hypothetical protein